MQEIPWFERKLTFGATNDMLPYFLERLSGTIVRIAAKVKNVPDHVLSTKFNDKWSVKQNIGHLAEVDEINNRRIGEMIAGISPMSPAVFEPKGDYNAMPIEAVLDYFDKTRKGNITRYNQLTHEELGKASLHPRLKVMMTPVDLAWFDAEHDDHHLVKINFILKDNQ
jgi:DinB superfamily